MPYKDPEKQKAAQHRSYLRNKQAVKQRQRERRAAVGREDRSGEYERRRLQREAARAAEPDAAPLVPRPVARRSRPPALTPEERALREEAEMAAENQRRLKEAALRRFRT